MRTRRSCQSPIVFVGSVCLLLIAAACTRGASGAADARGAPPDSQSLRLVPPDSPPEPAPPPPLGAAALAGDVARVQQLLRSGVEVNAVAHGGRTPLMLALAPYIGEPSSRSGPGPGTPEDRRRQTRKLKVAHLLVQRGADVARASDLGMTALHYAAATPGEEKAILSVVHALIGRGAKVDARTTTGLTPLRMAVDKRRPSIVRALINAGADPLAPDAKGNTPLGVAEGFGQREVVELLKKRP